MSIPFDSSVTTSPDVMTRQIGDESVLLDLRTERYLGFDDVSSCIWQVLTDGGSFHSMCEALLAEYEADPDRLRNDLEDFVPELLQRGLIQLNRPIENQP